MLVVLLFTCLLFTFSCFGLLLGICNDQYDWLRWSYCYLLVYYLLLAVLAFYSVFVVIYTTSFAGRYLSFSFNPLSVWQLSCFFAMLTIFLTSCFGWVNLLAACSLLFTLYCCELFLTVLVSSGLCLSVLYFMCFLQCIFVCIRVIVTVCWVSGLVLLVLS